MEIQESMSLNKNQLSILIEQREKEEDFRFYMLQKNTIHFLLPVQKLYEESMVRYVYDTTEKESFISYTKGRRLREESVKQLITQLLEALIQGKEYYFDEDSYLMNPECIFLDIKQNKYYFCYCPDYVEPIRKQILSMLGLLMNLIDYEDLSAVKLVYQIYQMVGEEIFSTNRILSYVKKFHFEEERNIEKPPLITLTPELERELSKVMVPPVQPSKVHATPSLPTPSPPGPSPPGSSPPGPPQPSPIQATIQSSLKSVGQYKEESNELDMTLNKGTIAFILSTAAFLVLFCAGYALGVFYTKIGHQLDIKKVVLYIVLVLVVEGYIAWKIFGGTEKKGDCDVRKEYKLLPSNKRSDTIRMSQFPFRIGKDDSLVNGVIMNPQVSRMHAIFTMADGKIYLQDVNSLNGTYVNEVRLQPQTNQLLQLGDSIRFANNVYLLSN